MNIFHPRTLRLNFANMFQLLNKKGDSISINEISHCVSFVFLVIISHSVMTIGFPKVDEFSSKVKRVNPTALNVGR